MFKKSLLTFILIVTLAIPVIVMGETGLSFSAHPLYPNKILPNQFSFEIKPGESAEESVKIVNVSEMEGSFTIAGIDSTTNDKGEFSYKLSTDPKTGAGAWIKPETNIIVIPGQGTATVKFKVDVPADAKLGDYVAGLETQAVSKVKTTTSEGIQLKVNYRINNKVNIKVTDNPQPIEKFELPQQFGPAQLYLYGSILLFLVVISYFASQKVKHHRAKRRAAHHPKE